MNYIMCAISKSQNHSIEIALQGKYELLRLEFIKAAMLGYCSIKEFATYRIEDIAVRAIKQADAVLLASEIGK